MDSGMFTKTTRALWAALALISTSTFSFAGDATLSTTKASDSQWRTNTQFGYSMEQNSSTGFSGQGGTALLVDFTHTLRRRVDLGLRTAAMGSATTHDKFYRMGSGPLFRFQLSEKWSLEAAILGFRETGLSGSETAYQSKGHTSMVSWHRQHQLGSKISLTAGGFVALNTGDFKLEPASAAVRVRHLNVKSNSSLSKGITFGMHVVL